MSYCPSQDWDRHADELDRAADEQMRFYSEHGDAIERITIALIRSGHSNDANASLVERAAAIAFLIYGERD